MNITQNAYTRIVKCVFLTIYFNVLHFWPTISDRNLKFFLDFKRFFFVSLVESINRDKMEIHN